MLAALEFLQHLAALRFPDALADDVLCSLRRNASEFLGFQADADHVARHGLFVITLGLFRQDFRFRIADFLHNRLFQDHFKRPFIRVNVYFNVFVPTAEIFLDRNDNGAFDLIQQIIGRDAPFFFQQGKRLEEFAVHFSITSNDM